MKVVKAPVENNFREIITYIIPPFRPPVKEINLKWYDWPL